MCILFLFILHCPYLTCGSTVIYNDDMTYVWYFCLRRLTVGWVWETVLVYLYDLMEGNEDLEPYQVRTFCFHVCFSLYQQLL